MVAKLTFHGGAGTVTGAHFLFETDPDGTDGKRILIDCGLLQGTQYGLDANYTDFPYDPAGIDAVIVTHAHADHIGRVPKLVRDGFRGPIISTAATRDLSAVMFDDAVGILRDEAREQGIEPIYTTDDVAQALNQWRTHEYHERFELGDDVQAHFLDAGHILGSSMVRFERNGVAFVATGDVGNSPAPLLPDTEALTDVQYLLTESVYGDRVHENRDDRIALLRDALTDTYEHGRTLLIPSFAIQRTQLLLYEINKLVESGAVPEMPVFLDSPLAARVTDVYREYTHLFNTRVQDEIRGGDDIFAFPHFTTVEDAQESQALMGVDNPKVILAGSGMSVGGRILLHEKRLLGDARTTILFVGYQGVGTLGRRIQDGAKTVTINGTKVRVRARTATIRGFSAHKDRDGLVAMVADTAPTLKTVFVAMGEPKSSLFLVQRLRDFLDVDAVAPEAGETQTLDF